jgi:glucose-1-phosphate thymidylyltransferase
MRAIVLAAGFGTRMGELGRSTPKGLMDLGGRTVLGELLADLDTDPLVQEIVIVSNGLFAGQYGAWLAEHTLRTPWELLSDGVTDPANRLGATGDLEWVLAQRGRGRSIVLASDNLYTFAASGIAHEMARTGRCQVCVMREEDPAAQRSAGCVRLDGEGRVVEMVEKPEEPFSDLLTAPLYAYTEEALSLIPSYLEAGGNPDAPGYLCAWLSRQVPLMAWRPAGSRVDIGSLAKLEEARRLLVDD